MVYSKPLECPPTLYRGPYFSLFPIKHHRNFIHRPGQAPLLSHPQLGTQGNIQKQEELGWRIEGGRASQDGKAHSTPILTTVALPPQNIFHGAMSLDQLYFARPVPQHSGYRCPVQGLYLCGSGAHPGE